MALASVVNAFLAREQPALPSSNAPTLDEIEQQMNGKGDRGEEARYRRNETPPGKHKLIVPRRL